MAVKVKFGPIAVLCARCPELNLEHQNKQHQQPLAVGSFCPYSEMTKAQRTRWGLSFHKQLHSPENEPRTRKYGNGREKYH